MELKKGQSRREVQREKGGGGDGGERADLPSWTTFSGRDLNGPNNDG